MPPPAVDLYWLPLGAGGYVVRFNGQVYEVLTAFREHHIRQWHRTRKALFGEQPLSGNTDPRARVLIAAALDDHLAPVGKPKTNDLGQIMGVLAVEDVIDRSIGA